MCVSNNLTNAVYSNSNEKYNKLQSGTMILKKLALAAANQEDAFVIKIETLQV